MYVTEMDPVLLVDSSTFQKSECGMVESPLIVGGEAAQPKEYPHMVNLSLIIWYGCLQGL